LKKKADGLSLKAFGTLKSCGSVSFVSLDELISAENLVRFLDAFVHKLDLDKFQFKVKELNSEGRPAFHTNLFLKIYLYDYHLAF
jgi:transposase